MRILKAAVRIPLTAAPTRVLAVAKHQERSWHLIDCSPVSGEKRSHSGVEREGQSATQDSP